MTGVVEQHIPDEQRSTVEIGYNLSGSGAVADVAHQRCEHLHHRGFVADPHERQRATTADGNVSVVVLLRWMTKERGERLVDKALQIISIFGIRDLLDRELLDVRLSGDTEVRQRRVSQRIGSEECGVRHAPHIAERPHCHGREPIRVRALEDEVEVVPAAVRLLALGSAPPNSTMRMSSSAMLAT